MNRACAASLAKSVYSPTRSGGHKLAFIHYVGPLPSPIPSFPFKKRMGLPYNWRRVFPCKAYSSNRNHRGMRQAIQYVNTSTPSLSASLPQSWQLCRWWLPQSRRQPLPQANFRKSEEEELE